MLTSSQFAASRTRVPIRNALSFSDDGATSAEARMIGDHILLAAAHAHLPTTTTALTTTTTTTTQALCVKSSCACPKLLPAQTMRPAMATSDYAPHLESWALRWPN
ncbi:MAG: hypothetical protein ACJ8F7_16785, partial [Gemmataceae bacterium]